MRLLLKMGTHYAYNQRSKIAEFNFFKITISLQKYESAFQAKFSVKKGNGNMNWRHGMNKTNAKFNSPSG